MLDMGIKMKKPVRQRMQGKLGVTHLADGLFRALRHNRCPRNAKALMLIELPSPTELELFDHNFSDSDFHGRGVSLNLAGSTVEFRAYHRGLEKRYYIYLRYKTQGNNGQNQSLIVEGTFTFFDAKLKDVGYALPSQRKEGMKDIKNGKISELQPRVVEFVYGIIDKIQDKALKAHVKAGDYMLRDAWKLPATVPPAP